MLTIQCDSQGINNAPMLQFYMLDEGYGELEGLAWATGVAEASGISLSVPHPAHPVQKCCVAAPQPHPAGLGVGLMP